MNGSRKHRSMSCGRLWRCAMSGLVSMGLLAAAAPAFATTTSPSFNSVVAQAMTYVGARTELPLQAPTFIGHANGAQHGYLAATASASSTSYRVSLQVSTTPVGLNSPALYQPPNGGLAAVIAGFGAQRVSSSNAAAQAVTLRMKPVSFAGVNQKLVKYAEVSLGHGIQGLYAYAPHPYSDVIEWREGEWAFRIFGSYFPADRSLAESIVAYLHAHLLPETHGLLTVYNAGDGQHTSLSWAFDNVIYTAWDYHHALSAVQMAMSMKPYSMPPSARFPSAIQGAMNSLKGQTTAPLQAPQNLGLPLARARLARSSAQFGRSYYQVNLQYGNGQGMMNQIGSFGAKVFGAQPTALAFLSQSALAPNFADLRWHTISLGNGISGKLYNQLGMVLWREGLWTFNVQAGSDAADVALAERMVGYLHTHLLPETHGSVTVKNTPAAQFSQLYWVWGDVLYHVYSVHSAMQGLEMAVSYAAF